MGSRDRNDDGQYVETVTERHVLDTFEAVDGPIITSSDVAAELDCTTEAARRKLRELYDRGVLDRRKTGRTLVYWRADGISDEIPDDDPFFAAEPASTGGPGDVSENVDDHLYGGHD